MNRGGDEVWDWKRALFLISEEMFTLGVPFSFSAHAAYGFKSLHYHLLLKIIKRTVISFLITSLLSLPPVASCT